MSKLYIKKPKNFTLVRGLEVISLHFVDSDLVTVVLEGDVKVEFSSLHKKTAKKILDENAVVPRWQMSEEERLETIDKNIRKKINRAKKDNKVKVAGLNKKNYSPTTQYLLRA